MNLTRREFIRALGIGAAGVSLVPAGATFAAAEATADAKPVTAPPRHWWVKTVDKPTVEIDWKNMKRFSEWRTTRGSLAEYRGKELDDKLNKLQAENLKKWEIEGKPGYTTKDNALKDAVNAARADFKLMGPQTASTPKDRGVPRYEGTPEENATIVTAAMRHMGACKIGFVELDENTMKLVYDENPALGKEKISFEDVEVGKQEKTKLTIPKKAKWAIVYNVQMSGYTMKAGPTQLGSLTTTLSYTRMWNILAQTHDFIRSLGYQSYGTTTSNGLGIAPAFAVMAGLGELSRLNRLITPEYGPMVRETMLFTDLPLAPTKPIDFGVMNFCKDCKICATNCPSKSLSMDREPTWDVKGPWNNPGHKAYFENSVTCRNYWNECGTNCGICFAVCPYAQQDEATLHAILKATTSTTTLFNPLIKGASDFVYPAEFNGTLLTDPEEWWHNTNLPDYGINSMQGGRKL
ncbi:MAG TPA: reductive dehalogenase [Chloroflexota bacterium]